MRNLFKILIPVFALGFFACGGKSTEPAITAALRIQNETGGKDLTDEKRTEVYNASTGDFKSLRFFILDEFNDTIKAEAEPKNISFKGNVPFLRTVLDAGKYRATLTVFQLEDFKGASSSKTENFEVIIAR
jgi:hypothetical protein